MADTRVTFTSQRSEARRHRPRARRGEAGRAPPGLHRHARLRQQLEFSNVLEPCAMFEKLGYVTLRFDMPGCGESEGERGNLICLEQVQAASDALTFLAKHPNVEADRIGMIGSSFGAAIAVYVDRRRQARRRAISSGGWATARASSAASIRRRRSGRSSPTCWRRASATARRPASR